MILYISKYIDGDYDSPPKEPELTLALSIVTEEGGVNQGGR